MTLLRQEREEKSKVPVQEAKAGMLKLRSNKSPVLEDWKCVDTQCKQKARKWPQILGMM